MFVPERVLDGYHHKTINSFFLTIMFDYTEEMDDQENIWDESSDLVICFDDGFSDISFKALYRAGNEDVPWGIHIVSDTKPPIKVFKKLVVEIIKKYGAQIALIETGKRRSLPMKFDNNNKWYYADPQEWVTDYCI